MMDVVSVTAAEKKHILLTKTIHSNSVSYGHLSKEIRAEIFRKIISIVEIQLFFSISTSKGKFVAFKTEIMEKLKNLES